MTPYLSSEMVIALFGLSDHHFPSPGFRENSSKSSEFSLSTTSFLSVGFDDQPRPVSTVSLLAAEKSICRLRLDLVEMLRISLHAVDYATKGYALGIVEFALSATKGRKKLEHLGRTIAATVQELSEAVELDDSQLGFSESARAISTALSSICELAYKISSHTVALLQEGIHQSSKELIQLGEHIACSLRLCIVAFMKQKVEYAEAVLRSIEEWRCGRIERAWKTKHSASAILLRDVHEWSIAASLKQMMESLCTIAVASLLPFRFQC